MTMTLGAGRSRRSLLDELRQWRQAAVLVGGCVLVGGLQAVLWSWLAPGAQYKVYKDGRFAALPTESTHEFTSIAIFAVIGLAVGLCVAVAAWAVRITRGPVTLLILTLANGLGALTAYLLGQVIAPGTDPASVGSAAVESIVTAPPVLGLITVIVAQPAMAAAAYTFLTLWSGSRGLDRPVPVVPFEPPGWDAAVVKDAGFPERS